MTIRPLKGNPPVSCNDACHKARGSRGGTDYAVPEGTPVLAMFTGIAHRWWNNIGGNYLTITDGKRVGYLVHVSKFLVETGTVVTEGETVALSGGRKGAAYSGDSTGPHLHANVDIAGNRYGMEEYLNSLNPASLTPTPITIPKDENMKIIRVDNGTIALVGEYTGNVYTAATGGQAFSIGVNSKAYGTVTGLTEDETTTLVNEANARRQQLVNEIVIQLTTKSTGLSTDAILNALAARLTA